MKPLLAALLLLVIVLENQSFRGTFGPQSAAPYLARELAAQGALLREYYAVSHASLGNYVAMVSGQAPNLDTQSGCKRFVEFGGTRGPDGQWIGQGCVYPREVKTIADQLRKAHLSWKNYAEDSALGTPPTCRHPEIGAEDTARGGHHHDQYATRHVPWVYFHSIIDTPECGKRVVDLAELPIDLATLKATPNFVFIVPDNCSNGHDDHCADNTSPGGYAGIDAFLKAWVPRITASAAFRKDGLLIITFDEADLDDPAEGSIACCNEQPGPNTSTPGYNGPGGGRTGAVLISRYIKPGTVSDLPYNHYSLLRSLEDIFRLPHLGYAGQQGLVPFGADVYTGR